MIINISIYIYMYMEMLDVMFSFQFFGQFIACLAELTMNSNAWIRPSKLPRSCKHKTMTSCDY